MHEPTGELGIVLTIDWAVYKASGIQSSKSVPLLSTRMRPVLDICPRKKEVHQEERSGQTCRNEVERILTR